MTAGGHLRELHRLHLRLREVQDELARGPRRLQAQRQFTERKRSELDETRQRLLEVRKTADAKSLQLRTNEAKIAELKLKLNTASSNREYDIIRGQIEADTMANSVLEDEILEALEKADQLQAEVARLEQEVAQAEAEEKRVAQEVGEREPSLKQEAERLETSIRSAEADLPGNIRELYHRLVQARGSDALAPVENDACSACYVALSPQKRVELKAGQVIFCQSCGRLLYRPED